MHKDRAFHRTGYLFSRSMRYRRCLEDSQLVIVLVLGLKRNLYSSLAAAQKGVKAIIENNGSSLDLEPFSAQLTRLDDMDHLDLTIAEERRRIEFAFCTISGKMFGK